MAPHNKSRLAIVTTHPVQYQAPWFRALSAHPDLQLTVFFGHRATPSDQAAAGFGIEFEWDVPLLEGYRFHFLQNHARRPSVSSFFGIDTPGVGHRLAEGAFDAVLVNGWHYKAAWQAIRSCWVSKVPVMVRGDSHLHNPRSAPKRALKCLPYRWFMPKFDGCLAVGSWSRDYYLHYGAQPHQIHIAPHLVEQRWSREAGQILGQREQKRIRLGLSPHHLVLVFVGKFVPGKRPMDFIEGIGQARQAGICVEGLMVGDGPLLDSCKAYVKNSGLPIRFTGFLNQTRLVEAYVASDGLILPSEETWGLVVNEAMSCGLPCIVSDQVGSGPDLIREGETGFLFPMGDVTALADKIGLLSRSPRLGQRMGQRAQARVGSRYRRLAVTGVLDALGSISVLK